MILRAFLPLAAAGLAAVGLASPLPANASGDFVGDATCLACHGDLSEKYAHTVHARALAPANARTELAARGCESCHGPGRAHATSGGADHTAAGWVRFGGTEPAAIAEQDRACLQCHEGDGQRFWHGSAHDSRGVGCSSCHTVMEAVSDQHLLSKPTEAALCGQCHHLQGAQARRTSHMPTRTGPAGAGGEGFMTCASCHNAHGTVADKLVDAHTINDNCTSCHAEKRGPFLWEHAPVSEDCLNCHVAHGSLKPNLLRLSAPRLCQSCHVQVLHAAEARVPESRFVVGTSCMQCHQAVHGSNHPSGAFFTR